MTRLIHVAACCLLVGPASAQVGFEAAERFHTQVLQPAMKVARGTNVAESKRLAPIVVAEFDKLHPTLQIGQVSDMQRLGRLYLEKKLLAEADLVLARGVDAWERAMGPAFPPLGLVYADLARARRLSGRPAEAENLLQRAHAIAGNDPTRDSDAYPIFVEAAALRRHHGDVAGAEELLRRMISFAEQMKGWEYVPNLIGVFEAYAEILDARGQAADARRYRSRAATIRRNYGQ